MEWEEDPTQRGLGQGRLEVRAEGQVGPNKVGEGLLERESSICKGPGAGACGTRPCLSSQDTGSGLWEQ